MRVSIIIYDETDEIYIKARPMSFNYPAQYNNCMSMTSYSCDWPHQMVNVVNIGVLQLVFTLTPNSR